MIRITPATVPTVVPTMTGVGAMPSSFELELPAAAFVLVGAAELRTPGGYTPAAPPIPGPPRSDVSEP